MDFGFDLTKNTPTQTDTSFPEGLRDFSSELSMSSPPSPLEHFMEDLGTPKGTGVWWLITIYPCGYRLRVVTIYLIFLEPAKITKTNIWLQIWQNGKTSCVEPVESSQNKRHITNLTVSSIHSVNTKSNGSVLKLVRKLFSSYCEEHSFSNFPLKNHVVFSSWHWI